jgi:hypothetical protein
MEEGRKVKYNVFEEKMLMDRGTKLHFINGKKEGTRRAPGMAGIEPTPPSRKADG